MQIRAGTAGEWAKSEHVLLFTHYQLFDPAKNTLAGAWYLHKLLGRYQQIGCKSVRALLVNGQNQSTFCFSLITNCLTLQKTPSLAPGICTNCLGAISRSDANPCGHCW